MADGRRQMINALQEIVVPRLRRQGFIGSFLHFRRLRPDRIDALTFQFDRHGGGFIIEIGQCPPNGFTTYWGKFIPPKKVRAWDLDVAQRSRIQPQVGSGTDSWFRYDDGYTEDAFRQIAETVLPHIDEAEKMFDDIS